MKLAIRHETVYRYAQPVTHTVQLLRVTPRLEAHQRVLEWNIETPGRRTRHLDAYGNVMHTLVVDQPHESLRVATHGVVEVLPLSNGRLMDDQDALRSALPKESFLVGTPLTDADESVRDFARSALPKGLRNPRDALVLAQAICDRVTYESGITNVTSTAAQALAVGRGVCQDHAHLFLACSRLMGVPARYVSGYVHPGTTEHAASHAWSDAWFADGGWTSVDVTHSEYTGDKHCRVAVGRDYESASPTRGVRTGGGEEVMDVRVTVSQQQ
jgi:transglutaminase-like putative cysteine protease